MVSRAAPASPRCTRSSTGRARPWISWFRRPSARAEPNAVAERPAPSGRSPGSVSGWRDCVSPNRCGAQTTHPSISRRWDTGRAWGPMKGSSRSRSGSGSRCSSPSSGPRREPAIRDFYDIDHAVRRLSIRPHEASFIALVVRKLAVPGNGEADVSAARLRQLRLQLEARLRPVLRPRDYAEFDLERAFELVSAMAASVRR
jgi:hypothetical protein